MKNNLRIVELSFVAMAALAWSAFSTVAARADDGTPPTATPAAAQIQDANSSASNPADSAVAAGEATAAPADATAAAATQEAATPMPATEEATAAPADTEAAATQEAATATTAPAADAVTEAATATPTDTEAAATQEAATATTAPATDAATEAATAATAANPAADAAAQATPAPEAAPTTAGAPLSQIPSGTDVVLLDNAGNPVDASSPEAADIIAHGDPIWCPTGIAPKPHTNNCTDSFSLFNGGFITALNNKTVSGTIWISNAYVSEGTSVTLDNTDLGTTVNFALTLQGGWNGNSTGTLIAGNSTFNAPLILNWNADVTINNIAVSGITGTSDPALSIQTPKNITLTNVTVTGNSGAGAVLDDVYGGIGTGNVTITNGDFEYNGGGTGLTASSKGAITVSGIKADHNGVDGADLFNSAAATPKNVTIASGADEFNDNGQIGLMVSTQGILSLKDIDALDNGMTGASLYNAYGASPQSINLTGINVFSENGAYGLLAYSNGPVTANNLIANGNTSWGAYLDNSTAAAAQPVTITGTINQFKDNLAGLFILSKGSITLNSIIASDNKGDPGSSVSGAQLDNCAYVGSACTGTGNILLTGINAFENNYRTGLSAFSAGTITISNLSADGNGWDHVTPANSSGSGAVLDNTHATSPKSITLTGINSLSGNFYAGLIANSVGAIALSNITANGNNGYGAYANNAAAATAQPITISGINSFNKNSGDDGLSAHSRGAVSLSNITADGNGAYGVFVTNTTASAPQPITISGTNIFSDNGKDGLNLSSRGAVALSNPTANDNGLNHDNPTSGSGPWTGYGVIIINALTTTSHQAVTISGTSQFENNWFYGLFVTSYGAISAAGVTAIDNGQGAYAGYSEGVVLDNCWLSGGVCQDAAAEPVTLSGANPIRGNAGDGLYVISTGAVALSNIDAENNSGGAGALIDNHLAAAPQAVTVSGTNTFNGNSRHGLEVHSKGAVTATLVTASNNLEGGVLLQNNYAGAAGNISLTGNPAVSGGMSHNGLSGVDILSVGAVSLSNVNAGSNGGYGTYVDNRYAAATQPVTLTGINSFSHNGADGLNIGSNGAVTLSNITANENGQNKDNPTIGLGPWTGYGVCIVNAITPSVHQAVAISGTSTFNANWFDGLVIDSLGAISLNNIWAANNGQGSYGGYGDGVYLNNCLLSSGSCTDPAAEPVNITGANQFDTNPNDGLEIYSSGAVSANNLIANSNGSWGVYLENNGSVAAQPVTITGTSNQLKSNLAGLYILSKGNITLNSMTASNNSGDPGSGEASGAQLDDCAWDGVSKCLGSGNITLTGTNTFEDNYRTGLQVKSAGTITINNLSSDGNGWDLVTPSNSGGAGAKLDNSYALMSKNIILTGANSFNGNHDDGMDVISHGAIVVSNITANGNNGGGVHIDNSGAATPQTITLNGVNVFHNNTNGVGLMLISHGAIAISNITATGNSTGGGSIDNSAAAAAQPITISGNNIFSNNSSDGLDVLSRGAVAVNNITASGNTGGGFSVTNTSAATPQPITLTGVNTFNNNHAGGFTALSNGAVTASNLTANGNVIGGASINSLSSTAASPQNVTLTGSSQFNNNGDSGLAVTTWGAITINNLTAGGNGTNHDAFGWGAYLDTCDYDNVGNTCNAAALAKGITLTGAGTFNNNYQSGLWATAKGPISVSSLTASGNHVDGAYLNNKWGAGSAGGVTLTGSNTFLTNADMGLEAYSTGAIAMNNLTANNNTGTGVFAETIGLTTPQNVTMTGANTFLNNGDSVAHSGDGLDAIADGNITINNLTAKNNAAVGAYLNDCLSSGGCTGSGSITLTGVNTFYDNYADGLELDTHKNITLSSITADKNGGAGVFGTASGAIVVLSGSLTGNVSYGWFLDTTATITLKGVFAYGNNGGSGDWGAPEAQPTIIRSYP